jgi:hypothetical protein
LIWMWICSLLGPSFWNTVLVVVVVVVFVTSSLRAAGSGVFHLRIKSRASTKRSEHRRQSHWIRNFELLGRRRQGRRQLLIATHHGDYVYSDTVSVGFSINFLMMTTSRDSRSNRRSGRGFLPSQASCQQHVPIETTTLVFRVSSPYMCINSIRVPSLDSSPSEFMSNWDSVSLGDFSRSLFGVELLLGSLSFIDWSAKLSEKLSFSLKKKYFVTREI